MSPRLDVVVERAKTLPRPAKPPQDAPWEFSYKDNYEWVIAAVGDTRELAWGTMTYGCTGSQARTPMPESVIQEGIREGHLTQEQAKQARVNKPAVPPCGWEHRVWLCVGVEGPPAVKETECYIPAPFYCGTCPRCGSPLAHARWDEDEEWPELRQVPTGVPRFIVPTSERVPEFVELNYGGAEYIDPTERTRSGNRA